MENPATGGALNSRSGRSDVAEFTRNSHNTQAASRAIGAGLICLPDAFDMGLILRCRLGLPERIWLAESSLLSLPPDEAEELAEAALHDLRAGPPVVTFMDVREDARDWAFFASPGEVKTYFSACWHRLTDRDRRGFLRAVRSKARPS